MSSKATAERRRAAQARYTGLLTRLIQTDREELGAIRQHAEAVMRLRSELVAKHAAFRVATRQLRHAIRHGEDIVRRVVAPNRGDTLPYDAITDYLNVPWQQFQDAFFHGLDQNYVRLCAGGKNFRCPLCGVKRNVCVTPEQTGVDKK